MFIVGNFVNQLTMWCFKGAPGGVTSLPGLLERLSGVAAFASCFEYLSFMKQESYL